MGVTGAFSLQVTTERSFGWTKTPATINCRYNELLPCPTPIVGNFRLTDAQSSYSLI